MQSNFCEDLDLEKEPVFGSETNKYFFKERLFFGPTGQIATCINRDTGETVAIKFVTEMEDFTNAETKILRKIKAIGSENYNIVNFYEDFYYKRNRCLVFQKLDIDLEDFTDLIIGGGLHLFDIRLIAQQVLVALDFLHSNGIAHRDIKPNNIMLVDRFSLKVKLIDMGFSEEIEIMENSCAYPHPYMPPEEIMSEKLDASLDMWCLALTLIYFYLKDQLFEYDTIEETLAAIVKMLGEPQCSDNFSFWKRKIKKYEPELRLNSLDDLLEIRPAAQDPIEREDLLSFIDFLKQMLVPTPQERITSAAALKHSFITMDHLSNFESSSPYVIEAHEAMRTYKFMTPQRLGATLLFPEGEKYNPEIFSKLSLEKNPSPSGNSYRVCSGNYASPTGNRVSFSSPKDETETILTPLGPVTTDSAPFWSEFFSTNDLVFESETSKYLLIESLGLGGTAIITKFINQETGETVVIKLGIDKDDIDVSEEKRILNKIKALGSENYNIVKFYEDFYYQKKQCLVFEKLDIDLESFTDVIVGGGLHLCDIRLIAQQVLVALDFLHSNGIAHRDLKPNNIMLVDRSSLKVKLIDMGFTEEIELMENICVNPLPFMPPEEMMSDKLDASFDMWCLALTLIYFYLKDPLFEYDTIEETLAAIVKMLGEPHCSNNFSFWKRKIEKYEPELRLNSLDDLLEIRPATQDPIEREDLLSFIDFLKQMLVPTPQERITSAAALKHSFITMDHLSNFESSSPYVLEAHEAMRTYKFMTPQRLRATSLYPKREINNPEEFTKFLSEKQTSPSSNNYCLCSGNCASNSEKQGSASGSNIDGQCSGNCAPPTVNDKKFKEESLNHSSETDYPGQCKDSLSVDSCGGTSLRLCSRNTTSQKNIVIGSGLYTESPVTGDLKDESTTILMTNDQQPADCGNKQVKILTSPLKKGTIMTSSPNKEVVEIKNKSKTVTFNPVIVTIPNQSHYSSHSSDQQEKIQSSLSEHSGFTVDSSLLKPNLDSPLFHKRLPASVSLSEQKQVSPPSCVVMDKKLNTEEKLSKKSEDTKLHIQDNTSLTSCEDPSHLVEVKTHKKYWKRVKNFFSNMNWFGLCLPTKK